MRQFSTHRAATRATRLPTKPLSKTRGKKCWCMQAARGGAMATTPLSAPTTVLRSPLRHRALLLLPFPPRAASSGEDTADQEPSPAAATKTATADDEFEERILQIKSRVGPKKRGPRKKKGGAASSAASAKAVTLPPVPLREPRSALGPPVEFGFTAYSERLNGALAAVGLAAVLLVELGSGQALVKYHQPATLFLQAYTVAAAAAVFVKYEKERISTWPGPK